MINLAITLVVVEMEQQQTNRQEEGKQNCSNVLNLTSTHFFCLAKTPLIIDMAIITIKQMEDEKKTLKVNGNSRANWFSLVQPQPLLAIEMIGRGKEPKKNIQIL